MFVWDWQFWVLWAMCFGPGVLVGWTGRAAWLEMQEERRAMERWSENIEPWVVRVGEEQGEELEGVRLIEHVEDVLGRPYDWEAEGDGETVKEQDPLPFYEKGDKR